MSRSAALARIIKEDREHGASWLAQEARRCLALAAEESSATEPGLLLAEINNLARCLAESRPSMAPIANAVARLVYESSSAAVADVAALRAFVVQRAETLADEAERSTAIITQLAAEAIGHCPVLMTVSYSSTVVRAVMTVCASVAATLRLVLAVESRSPDGLAYGEVVSRLLGRQGVPVEIVPDARVETEIARAGAVVVGADSILPNGALINGWPTLAVAQSAGRHSIPLFVLAETAKINAAPLLGRPVEIEPGFDLIPTPLIERYVTERGPMEPSQMRALAEEWAVFLAPSLFGAAGD